LRKLRIAASNSPVAIASHNPMSRNSRSESSRIRGGIRPGALETVPSFRVVECMGIGNAEREYGRSVGIRSSAMEGESEYTDTAGVSENITRSFYLAKDRCTWPRGSRDANILRASNFT
jgi:hypothetical protein